MESIPSRGLFVTGTDTGVGKTVIASLIVRELRTSGTSVGVYKPACSGAEWSSTGDPVWDDIERLYAAVTTPISDGTFLDRISEPSKQPWVAGADQRKGHETSDSGPSLRPDPANRDDLKCVRTENRNSSIRTQEQTSLKSGDVIDRDKICPQRFLAPLAPPMAAIQESRHVDGNLLFQGAQWWRDRVDVLIVEGAGGLFCPMTELQIIADVAEGFRYPLVIVARCGLGTINHTLLTIEAAKARSLSIAGIVLNQSSESDNFELAQANAREIEKRSGTCVLGFHKWMSTKGIERHGMPMEIDWRTLCDTKAER